MRLTMPKSAVLDWAIDTPEGAKRFLSERGIEPSWGPPNGTVCFTKRINKSAARVIKETLELTTKERATDMREELRGREDWDIFRRRHGIDYK